jgi:hypothetical protein
MSDMSDKGSDFVRDLAEAARQNPLSAALIGMGVILLFTGRSSVPGAGDFAGDFVRRTGSATDAAGDAFDATRSGLRSAAASVTDRISSASRTLRDSGAAAVDSASRFGREQTGAVSEVVSEYVRDVPNSGGELFNKARSGLSDVFERQPLALGAIGLAIGAGIAATLPATAFEADYLGETSDALKDKAVDFATDQTDRLASVAERVAGAVTDEARRQGLTAEDVKSAAGDISQKAGRIAGVAGKSLAERLRSTAR